MKATHNPTAKESSKQRALRIVLDYHRRGDALVRSKLFWTAIATTIAAGYVAWLLVDSAQAARQLSPGDLAAVHSSLNSQCAACHQNFVPLRSDADGAKLLLASLPGKHHVQTTQVSCAKCHEQQTHPHHMNQLAGEAASCAACHAEHQGGAANLTRTADRACTTCHADIEHHRDRSQFDSPIQNVSQFAKSSAKEFRHPAFRSLPATDHNNFRFNHQLHMLPGQWPRGGKPEGAWKLKQIAAELREQYRTSADQTLDSLVQLDCQSCHEAERHDGGPQSRADFVPISFERHCRACHPLQVTQQVQGDLRSWNIRHGLPQSELRQVLLGISAGSELNPAIPRLTPNVPIPGKTAGNNLAQNLGDAGQVEAWQRSLFRQQCLKCHLDETPASTPVAEPADFPKPILRDKWLPHARFDHRTHEGWANCRDCHSGADATEAVTRPPLDDDQVLIPNIDNCLQCHAPESTHATFRATARFDCAECHRYHQPAGAR